MSSKTANIYNDYKYPVIIGLLFFGLVFSKWILSASQFLLLFAVLSDTTSRNKLYKAFRAPVVLALISIYTFFLIGMFWSDDLSYGIKDLQIKLPILVFPLLFYAAGPLKRNTGIYLLLFFTGCVLLLSIISLINYYISPVIPDRIAIGQSHIRFSLLICFSLLILIHYSNISSRVIKASMIPAGIVLIYFLVILQSFTGYIVVFALICILPFLYWHTIRKKMIRFAIYGIIAILSVIAIWGYVDVKSNCFPHVEKAELSKLDKQTVNGHYYNHDTNTLLAENGHLVYIYIQEQEMVNAWNQRSKKSIVQDSSYMFRTNLLMRYLTSKDLRKDNAGVYSLTEKDIRNIEQGYSNYLLSGFDPYRKRIYRFLWELNYYKLSGDPSGHSLTQRLEFWKTAVQIIASHPFFGIGTGDITNAFQDEYNILGSKLKPEYRLRSHNQFLSVTVALGFAGLLVFLFTLAAPFIFHKIPDRRLYLGYIFIFLLSMLNEDTLETQVGVTFYALFNSFLLFILPPKNTSEDEKERIQNLLPVVRQC
jgi:hypothetical protein